MRYPIVLSLLALLTAHAPLSQAQPSSPPISVVSYNVQFLPGLAGAANKRRHPEHRARRIAEEMSRFDIVALQETFDTRWRKTIIDELRGHWDGELSVLVSPQPESFKTNGGCLLLSRFPFAKTSSVVYTNFSTPAEYGITADGYAAKGCIHARIELGGGGQLDVFVTHLEARAPHLRPLQYGELAAFIAGQSDPRIPMLLLGDLNTNGTPERRGDPDSQYAHLMAALKGARGGGDIVDLWPQLHGDAHGGTSDQESAETGTRIDYILLGNADSRGAILIPTDIRIDPYADATSVYLSDHNALIATFTVEASP